MSFAARRKLAQHITARRVNVGLVEGDPKPAKISDGLDYLPREAFEKLRSIRPEKRSSLLKPSRMGEVMQTNDRLNSPLMQALEHLAVTLQRRPGQNLPSSGSIRLHSSESRSALIPMSRAISKSRSAFSHQSQALPQFVAGLDPSRQLPVRPLIAIVAFNLVSGGGHAPQKIFGKSEIAFRTCAAGSPLHSYFVIRTILEIQASVFSGWAMARTFSRSSVALSPGSSFSKFSIQHYQRKPKDLSRK